MAGIPLFVNVNQEKVLKRISPGTPQGRSEKSARPGPRGAREISRGPRNSPRNDKALLRGARSRPGRRPDEDRHQEASQGTGRDPDDGEGVAGRQFHPPSRQFRHRDPPSEPGHRGGQGDPEDIDPGIYRKPHKALRDPLEGVQRQRQHEKFIIYRQ